MKVNPHSYLLQKLLKKNTQKEISQNYQDYLKSCTVPYVMNYPNEILEIRRQIIQWIDYICRTLTLTLDSLFSCVCLFDKYISMADNTSKLLSLFEINLTAIACLSLATKIEEINCNYMKFFTDNILNTPENIIYTTKDVARKEFEILKVLKFKILYKTAFHFNDLFMTIFPMIGHEDSLVLKAINEKIIIEYLSSEEYMIYPPWIIAMLAFRDTELQYKAMYPNYMFNISLCLLVCKVIMQHEEWDGKVINFKTQLMLESCLLNICQCIESNTIMI